MGGIHFSLYPPTVYFYLFLNVHLSFLELNADYTIYSFPSMTASLASPIFLISFLPTSQLSTTLFSASFRPQVATFWEKSDSVAGWWLL